MKTGIENFKNSFIKIINSKFVYGLISAQNLRIILKIKKNWKNYLGLVGFES